MNRHDIESFFKTLLLGDFEENQSTSGQVVGGLIALIPILGQVMAARDVTGSIYAIGVKGGFKSATPVQLVNLGFAAFGAIPEVGPVFKLIFKPLWRERQLAKGVINSGLQAIEAMRGMAKGSAVTWIRRELLGKWGPLTAQAIAAVNMGIDSCIDLTEFLATAGGWKSWLIPSSVQALAKELLPQIKALKGTVNEPLQRASNEIKEFLIDLLGEQGAAVAMAITANVAVASAVPATRTRGGHNAADPHTKGQVPAREGEHKVGASDRTDAQRGKGSTHSAVARTLRKIGKPVNQVKGLIGEHVVDYHELKRLGGDWTHDEPKGHWSPKSVKKLNDQRRGDNQHKGPIHIVLSDLGEINRPGIDAVWEHGGQYTVTEAKASASMGAVYAFGKYKEKQGWIPTITGVSTSIQELHYVLADYSDKGDKETPTMQMSKAWVADRATREGGLTPSAEIALTVDRTSRRVALVTLESSGATAHAYALEDVAFGRTDAEVHVHADHGVALQWSAADIDAVEQARKDARNLGRKATPEHKQQTSGRSKNEGKKFS